MCVSSSGEDVMRSFGPILAIEPSSSMSDTDESGKACRWFSVRLGVLSPYHSDL